MSAIAGATRRPSGIGISGSMPKPKPGRSGGTSASFVAACRRRPGWRSMRGTTPSRSTAVAGHPTGDLVERRPGATRSHGHRRRSSWSMTGGPSRSMRTSPAMRTFPAMSRGTRSWTRRARALEDVPVAGAHGAVQGSRDRRMRRSPWPPRPAPGKAQAAPGTTPPTPGRPWPRRPCRVPLAPLPAPLAPLPAPGKPLSCPRPWALRPLAHRSWGAQGWPPARGPCPGLRKGLLRVRAILRGLDTMALSLRTCQGPVFPAGDGHLGGHLGMGGHLRPWGL